MLNEKIIIFFGKRTKVACDRQCNKAWGINSRPEVRHSDDEDDTSYKTDAELGEAPLDPGTYEGGHAKPLSPDLFANKWCVRECERCAIMEIDGDINDSLTLPDYSVHKASAIPALRGHRSNS